MVNVEYGPPIITSLNLKFGGVVLMLEKQSDVANHTQCPDVVVCELDFAVVFVVWDTVFQWVSGDEACSVRHILPVWLR